MNLQASDIEHMIKMLGDQGLWFFALYIVYHYTGQIVGMISIIILAKFFVRVIDGWIQKYFQLKEMKLKLKKEENDD